MRDQRRRALKTIVHLISNLLWVMGLLVGLAGVYLLLSYKHSSLFFSNVYIILPAVLALCSAVLLVVIGCFGSCHSISDSPCLQGLFVYLLVLVLCVESTASALAYLHYTKMDSELAPLKGVFQNYTGSSQDPNSRAVDIIQEELHCCGVTNYTDWLDTPWFHSTGELWLPHSCCNSSYRSCNGRVDQPWRLNSQGCMVKLEMAVQFVLSFIMWCSLWVFLVEVALFLTVGQLMIDRPADTKQEHKRLLS
ncbi:tetraspanin 37 [Cheilinus undulatus]|uniref:tetraspanin 37 n=1 Tax=Cheilinus undulatus TaxID=241271 RepID=UPI001BD68D7E|nr:tetraspanin 37 [Cheilinus undulatus]